MTSILIVGFMADRIERCIPLAFHVERFCCFNKFVIRQIVVLSRNVEFDKRKELNLLKRCCDGISNSR